METLDKVQLGVEQAEADELPELYDKRPDWPQAEVGHSRMTTQLPESVPHSQCCKWATVILYSTPLVPSPGFWDWMVSTFCGLVETMMHNQSWQENHTFAARPGASGRHSSPPQTCVQIPSWFFLK